MTDYETLTYDEARRRVPTYQFISDRRMREEVLGLTTRAPPYFWIRPGSYSGYHNAERHGLWHHTLKLSAAIETLAPMYRAQNRLNDLDRDRAHAAAILHDQMKNGEDPESDQTSNDHPSIMAERIRTETSARDLGAIVETAVREHMGGFDDSMYPSSAVSELVHTADMLAADDDVNLGVPSPVPKELSDLVSHTIEVPDR